MYRLIAPSYVRNFALIVIVSVKALVRWGLTSLLILRGFKHLVIFGISRQPIQAAFYSDLTFLESTNLWSLIIQIGFVTTVFYICVTIARQKTLSVLLDRIPWALASFLTWPNLLESIVCAGSVELSQFSRHRLSKGQWLVVPIVATQKSLVLFK